MAFLVIAASLVVGVPRTPHKSKHKHFRLNINDNELSDIRSAFDSFRDAETKRFSDVSTDIAKDDANSDNDAIDNHLRRESFHHSQMPSLVHPSQNYALETFNRRHHRHHHHHHTTSRTTAPTTAAVKSHRASSNDDDEDDYFDAPPSRHYGDSTSSNRSNRVVS